MSGHTESAAAWIYSGLWAGIVRWLRVPPEPPTLPPAKGEEVRSFRPADGFLRYLKFWFWIALLPMDVGIVFVWIIILTVNSEVAWWLLVPALILAIVPDVIAYVAIHLRFDTTWYVMSGRSLRIRRGVWKIHETTITYENIQNVKVAQGPVQRKFGIATVVVETAGGGSGGQPGHGGGAALHQRHLEGLENAHQIRDLIMTKVRASTSAGLGDERQDHRAASKGHTPAQLEALRAIRDEAKALRLAATRP